MKLIINSIKGIFVLKKRYLLSISLIITLLFGTYTFFSQRQQEQYANEIFIRSIDEAYSCFGVDYNKIDENDKNYYFIKVASNLHTARDILPLTSYGNIENEDKYLANAISKLYLSMTVQRTPEANNRWIAVTEKREAIFECLHYISINPNDKKNWDLLSKIAEDIGY